MSEIHLVREYLYPPAKVWAALTDPALMARWMVAAFPEGFATTVGTRFRFVGKPRPGWNGIVDCEVLACTAPSLLHYSWTDSGDQNVMHVRYLLEPTAGGTRFRFHHTGFRGVGGFLLAKAIMAPIRKRMFGPRISQVLESDPR